MCATCGTQFDEQPAPPAECPVCVDERQYVPPDGQQWTTLEELATTRSVRIETDGDLLGVGIAPSFAIPQRALHVQTDAGNILWDCTSLVTQSAVDALAARGGVDRIVISHPHFYSAMVEWSDALGGVPILLHAADRSWIQRDSPNITFWDGDVNRLSSTVCLYRCGGHFPGSTLMHWTAAPNGRSVVLAGDTLHVTADRRHVTFMYSVPNYIPAHPDHVMATRERLAGLAIDDIYGFTWGLNVIGGGREALDDSIERYLNAVGRQKV
jgi:glyoxylase-like metal-dependent hydrolase (beta-lactamase superfamily II)